MVPKQKIGLAVEQLTCQLRVFVEKDLSSVVFRMYANHTVKVHDWVRLEHKVFTVAPLGLIRIVDACLLIIGHLWILKQVFRL